MRLGNKEIKFHPGEAVFPLLVLLAGIMYIYDLQGIGSPHLNLLLIRPLLIVLFPLSLYLFFTRGFEIKRGTGSEETGVGVFIVFKEWSRPLIFILFFLLYVYVSARVSFLYTTFFFVLAVLLLLGERGMKQLFLIPALVSSFVYLVFVRLLGVLFP